MNLPNRLTVMRIIMIPVIILIAIFPYSQFGIEIPMLQFGFVTLSAVNIVMLVLFCIASFTDFLDGYLARKNNLVTTFGKFADPLADKMLITAAFLVFLQKGVINSWAVMIVMAREFMVAGVRLAAVAEGTVIAASIWGKLKTVSQMAAVIIALIVLNIPSLNGVLVTNVCIWISVILTVLSGADYLIKNWHLMKLK